MKVLITGASSGIGREFARIFAKKGYDSAATQFFIMLEDHSSLDGYYAAFGKVIEGMEIVEKMGELETDSLTEKPLVPPVIESMTVETFGVDYGEPTRYEPFDINEYVMNMQ